jgi:hypothetical protein
MDAMRGELKNQPDELSQTDGEPNGSLVVCGTLRQ